MLFVSYVAFWRGLGIDALAGVSEVPGCRRIASQAFPRLAALLRHWRGRSEGPVARAIPKLGHKNQTFTGDVYVDVSPEMMKAIPDAVDELFGDGTQAPWPGAFNGG